MRNIAFTLFFFLLSFHAFAAEQLVVIYTTSWCGHCKSVKTYLNNLQIPFTNYDIETSDIGKQKFTALKGKGVPLIFVGSDRIDGFDKVALEKALINQGLLK